MGLTVSRNQVSSSYAKSDVLDKQDVSKVNEDKKQWVDSAFTSGKNDASKSKSDLSANIVGAMKANFKAVSSGDNELKQATATVSKDILKHLPEAGIDETKSFNSLVYVGAGVEDVAVVVTDKSIQIQFPSKDKKPITVAKYGSIDEYSMVRAGLKDFIHDHPIVTPSQPHSTSKGQLATNLQKFFMRNPVKGLKSYNSNEIASAVHTKLAELSRQYQWTYPPGKESVLEFTVEVKDANGEMQTIALPSFKMDGENIAVELTKVDGCPVYHNLCHCVDGNYTAVLEPALQDKDDVKDVSTKTNTFTKESIKKKAAALKKQAEAAAKLVLIGNDAKTLGVKAAVSKYKDAKTGVVNPSLYKLDTTTKKNMAHSVEEEIQSFLKNLQYSDIKDKSQKSCLQNLSYAPKKKGSVDGGDVKHVDGLQQAMTLNLNGSANVLTVSVPLFDHNQYKSHFDKEMVLIDFSSEEEFNAIMEEFGYIDAAPVKAPLELHVHETVMDKLEPEDFSFEGDELIDEPTIDSNEPDEVDDSIIMTDTVDDVDELDTDDDPVIDQGELQTQLKDHPNTKVKLLWPFCQAGAFDVIKGALSQCYAGDTNKVEDMTALTMGYYLDSLKGTCMNYLHALDNDKLSDADKDHIQSKVSTMVSHMTLLSKTVGYSNIGEKVVNVVTAFMKSDAITRLQSINNQSSVVTMEPEIGVNLSSTPVAMTVVDSMHDDVDALTGFEKL